MNKSDQTAELQTAIEALIRIKREKLDIFAIKLLAQNTLRKLGVES